MKKNYRVFVNDMFNFSKIPKEMTSGPKAFTEQYILNK